jgi:hypothetical protein
MPVFFAIGAPTPFVTFTNKIGIPKGIANDRWFSIRHLPKAIKALKSGHFTLRNKIFFQTVSAFAQPSRLTFLKAVKAGRFGRVWIKQVNVNKRRDLCGLLWNNNFGAKPLCGWIDPRGQCHGPANPKNWRANSVGSDQRPAQLCGAIGVTDLGAAHGGICQ